jgi:hypothetical protein
MPIGRPLSPVSVAGARRRDDRRDDRGPGANNGPGNDNRSPVKTVAVAAAVGPVAAVATRGRR